MPCEPARSKGEKAPTVQTRIKRPCGIALDLQREQEHLQQDDAREQEDGLMTRRYADHGVLKF